MSYPVITVEQPAGTFYLTAMPAEEVIRISSAKPRIFDSISLTSEGGIQREPSARRIRSIAEYAGTSDAAFPTAILLAIKSEDCTLQDGQISVERNKVADIVDGQHRVLGLTGRTSESSFMLPVIFIIDATQEEKALLFATINGTQTKVPASLVYDLYGVSEWRSPAKTCHEIARTLNSMSESPWYRRLKMLGKKSHPGSSESLSQGTFVKFLLPHVSSKPERDAEFLKRKQVPPPSPDAVFNEYFREEKDSQILKVLLNTFDGARRAWEAEWNDPENFVLTKSLGFSGIMKALPDMVQLGRSRRDLSVEFFTAVFQHVKSEMEVREVALTSDYFSASASGEAEFRNLIRGALQYIQQPTGRST